MTPQRIGPPDDLPDAEPDWATVPAAEVPPWRRHDRALVDAVRAAAAGGGHDPGVAAVAREIRRLADLNADGALSDEEFVAGVRARLDG
jgi:hypothetical protein